MLFSSFCLLTRTLVFLFCFPLEKRQTFDQSQKKFPFTFFLHFPMGNNISKQVFPKLNFFTKLRFGWVYKLTLAVFFDLFFLKLTFRMWSQVMLPWKKHLNIYLVMMLDDLVVQKANLKFKKLKLLKRFKVLAFLFSIFISVLRLWPVSSACLLLASGNFQQVSNHSLQIKSQTSPGRFFYGAKCIFITVLEILLRVSFFG